MCSLHCVACSVQCAVCSVHFVLCSVNCVVYSVHTPASGLTHIRDNTAQGHSTGGFLKEATSRVTVFQGKSSGGPVDTAGYIYICCTTLIIKILLARWDS